MNRNLLITGASQEERLKQAIKLVLKLLCKDKNNAPCNNCRNCQRIEQKNHPNVIFIEPPSDEENELPNQDHKEIKIEQIRKLIEENQKANFEDSPSVFIVTHMHMLTKSASNALLKTLEESSKEKYFFALAPSSRSVLATIASRLVLYRLKPEPMNNKELSIKAKEKIWAITTTKPIERTPFCVDFASNKLELLLELEEFAECSHMLLNAYLALKDQSITPQLTLLINEALAEASSNLKRNLNPKLVVEHMLFHKWPYAYI